MKQRVLHSDLETRVRKILAPIAPLTCQRFCDILEIPSMCLHLNICPVAKAARQEDLN
jgi:hypothetical protein